MIDLRKIILILSVALVPVLSYAQNTKKQESRKAAIQREIEIINRQLKENSRNSAKALSSLTLVRKKISSRKALIDESESEIRTLNDSILIRQKEIDQLQDRLDTLNHYYGKLVQNAYRNRDSRIWYMYILSSANLSQAFRRTGYLRGLSSAMNRQAEDIKETTALLETRRDSLLSMKRAAEAIKVERVKDMDLLKVEENESETLVAQLNKDKRKYQQELQKKNREVEALNREIAEIIRKATAKKSTASSSKKTSSSKAASGKSTSTAIDTKLNSRFASNKGRLPWPVEGTVIETFGQHYHPVYKNVKLPFSNGVTVAVTRGATVKAVFDGEVAQIVVMPGYNNCILVQHGEYFTFYCKMGSVAVKAGDKVKTGQVLGSVATIGGEDQLHFQLWSGRTPQNPENWLK